jgi:hypothetical protein
MAQKRLKRSAGITASMENCGNEEIAAALHLCEKSRLMRKVIRGMVTVDEIPLNWDVVELMQYYRRNKKKVIMITRNEEIDLLGEIACKNGLEGMPIFLEHGDKSARVEKMGNEMGWQIVHCDNEHKKSFEKRFGTDTPHFVLAGEQLEFYSLKEKMDGAENALLEMTSSNMEVVFSFDADLVMVQTDKLLATCLLPKNRKRLMQVLQKEARNATQAEVDEVVGFLKKIDDRRAALGNLLRESQDNTVRTKRAVTTVLCVK